MRKTANELIAICLCWILVGSSIFMGMTASNWLADYMEWNERIYYIVAKESHKDE